MKLIKIFILLIITSSLSAQEEAKDFLLEVSLGIGTTEKLEINESQGLGFSFETTALYKNILLSLQSRKADKGLDLDFGDNPNLSIYTHRSIAMGYQMVLQRKIRFQAQLGVGKVYFVGDKTNTSFVRDKSSGNSKILKFRILSNNKVLNLGLLFDYTFNDTSDIKAMGIIGTVRLN